MKLIQQTTGNPNSIVSPRFPSTRPRRLRFHAPCFYKGEIWSVEPPGCLCSACNDVSESVATAPTQGLTCSAPRRRKGQVFPLVSLILKECGIPSDSGQTPKYISLLTSRSWKEHHGLDVFAIFFKQFWLFMWGNTFCRILLNFRGEVETRWVKEHQRVIPTVISSLAAGQWSCLGGWVHLVTTCL